MENELHPFDRESSIVELCRKWDLPYHTVHGGVARLGLRPTKGRGATIWLSVEQQRHLASELLKTRSIRPAEIGRLSADETRQAFASLESKLDRLTKQVERRDALIASRGEWNSTLMHHLDVLDGPDSAQGRRLLELCDDPLSASEDALMEGAAFLALISGILARRLENDDDAYARLVAALASQSTGRQSGQLSGQTFVLGAMLEGAIHRHATRAEALQGPLLAVLQQVCRWAADAQVWMDKHVPANVPA